VVRGGIRWGSRNEPGGLQKQLMDRLGISERHATLIARDQIGKLQGQVTQATQQAAGVVSYVWRTVDDERVRGRPGGRYPKANPSHWALDGLTFQWDHPPVCGPGSQRGHPGHAILCRCFASPILPDDITD
jgi:SPP1 gp7 family putative phage head morphogenesis protein